MLTGVYPQQQEAIEIDGVKFQFSLMPPKVHRNIQSRLVAFNGISQEDILKTGRMEEMLECFEDVVAYAVKGHEGFKDSSQKEIAFKTSRRTFKGETYDVVDGEVLKAYYYSGVIEPLAAKILEKHVLSGQDQKN